MTPLNGPDPQEQDAEKWYALIERLSPGRTQHWVFCRYVLGEKAWDAFWIALAADDGEPLTAPVMRHIAAHWNDEEIAA